MQRRSPSWEPDHHFPPDDRGQRHLLSRHLTYVTVTLPCTRGLAWCCGPTVCSFSIPYKVNFLKSSFRGWVEMRNFQISIKLHTHLNFIWTLEIHAPFSPAQRLKHLVCCFFKGVQHEAGKSSPFLNKYNLDISFFCLGIFLDKWVFRSCLRLWHSESSALEDQEKASLSWHVN